MTTTHTKRAIGKVLTLDEIRAFIAECDRLGVTGSTPVAGVAGLRGVRELTVKTGVVPRKTRQ